METHPFEQRKTARDGGIFTSKIWMFPKIVGTPKWMVYFMENPMNKWMIWGFSHYFWFNTHMLPSSKPTTLKLMGLESSP